MRQQSLTSVVPPTPLVSAGLGSKADAAVLQLSGSWNTTRQLLYSKEDSLAEARVSRFTHASKKIKGALKAPAKRRNGGNVERGPAHTKLRTRTRGDDDLPPLECHGWAGPRSEVGAFLVSLGG